MKKRLNETHEKKGGDEKQKTIIFVVIDFFRLPVSQSLNLPSSSKPASVGVVNVDDLGFDLPTVHDLGLPTVDDLGTVGTTGQL